MKVRFSINNQPFILFFFTTHFILSVDISNLNWHNFCLDGLFFPWDIQQKNWILENLNWYKLCLQLFAFIKFERISRWLQNKVTICIIFLFRFKLQMEFFKRQVFVRRNSWLQESWKDRGTNSIAYSEWYFDRVLWINKSSWMEVLWRK